MKKLLILLYLTISTMSYAPTCFEQMLDIKYKRTINLVYSAIELNQLQDSLKLQETGKENLYPWNKFKTRYEVINKIGAMGAWQMTPIALKDIGYKGTKQEFLNSPEIQRECIIKFLKKNAFYIKHYIPNYQSLIGTKINGITITYSGLIAGAFFGGIGNLRNFINKGIDAFDGNCHVSDYVKKFANYDIELVLNI